MDIDKKMPGMRKFRESFRGYRKEDVNAYLEQMYLQLNKKAEETPRKLAASSDIDLARSEETEKLKKEIEELNRTIAALGEKAESSEKFIASMTATQEQLSAENVLLKQKLIEAEANASNTVSNDEAMREKAELYDKMSIQLGDMVISANKNADQLLKEAANEADLVRSKAIAEAVEYKEQAKAQANELLGSVRAMISEMTKMYISNYESLVEEAHRDFSEITAKAEEQAKLLQAHVDTMRATAESELSADAENAAK